RDSTSGLINCTSIESHEIIIMSQKSYKLYYFRARGRGEFIRLAFLIAGVEFEDFCVDIEKDWPAFKATGKCPFNQVPILEIKEDAKSEPIVLSQSVAILRYLANEFGLAPDSNLGKAKADAIVDAVMDIRAKKRDVHFERDPSLKEKLSKDFLESHLPSALKSFQKLLEANEGGQGFFVGKKLTYADISFFNFLNSWVAKDKIKGYPVELENFPLLRGLYERVRDIPAVKKRLETRPDTVL
ncbi:unnamed protein product, partial [Pocillopora meandrina]